MPERHFLRISLGPALAVIEGAAEVGRQRPVEKLPAVVRQAELAVGGGAQALLRRQEGVAERQPSRTWAV